MPHGDPALPQPALDVTAPARPAPGAGAPEPGELYRLLVENVQDYAVFALSPEGHILSWNRGAERIKGYRPDEIIGKHFSIFYPAHKVAEDFPGFELREAARTGRFEDEDWRIRKDGTRFWANVVITALRDGTGRLLGYGKVTRDLTDRRAAEEALRLSEERFRLLIQSVRDYAIFLLDPTGHVATWNDGAERIKGYIADEIVGRHFSAFYPPDKVAEGFPDYELEVAAREGRFEDEGWRLRKDGTRFWANVVITALRNAEGTLVGFAKITRDLTERREAEARAIEDARRVAAEEAARRSADVARERIERLQSLTAALAAAYSVRDVADVIFSDGFAALQMDAGALALDDPSSPTVPVVAQSGYVGTPTWAKDGGASSAVPVVEAMRTGRAVVCTSRAERDARFPAVAAVLAPYEVSVVLPLVSRGRTVGALALHRKSGAPLDPDLLPLAEAFAQQCAQAVERAQLYEAERRARREAEDARKQADEANRAKAEFLAAMSHELRTPLNAIGGYAQLMEMGVGGDVTDQQREQLGRIRRGQQHLLRIINDILNFSRIDAGQVEYTFGEVPLREVVDAVGLMVEPQAATRQLQLELHVRSTDAVAWADRAKTEQIVLNLLSNAVKFTEPGGRITVSCHHGEGGQVELTVQDTGSGIPADALERIFEPFVQAGRSLTTNREGTGLGLAISRDLARGMGGDIRVVSEVGRGSTFTLTLPRPAGT